MAYYQLSLERKVKNIWKKEKVCKRLKRKVSFTNPVENILSRVLERSRRIKTLEHVYADYKIIKILDEVIEDDYFGNTQNRKRFYFLVNKITTQSHYECVYISLLSKGYNIETMSWLLQEAVEEKDRRKILQNTNLFLLKYVVKPLIKHFYHPLKSYRGYEIKFIRRKEWHCFQHKVLNKLLRLNFLIPVTSKHASRGELKLFPKASCDELDYRPIIYPKRNPGNKARFKGLLRKIEEFSRTFSTVGNTSLFVSWRNYCKATEGWNIYGIKLDIKDAFGYIDVDKLCRIIEQSKFSISDKKFILNHIQNQYVTFHKKLYRWNHGLLQGDHLSSSLCNLFLSNFEKEHLQEFRGPGCFLHRVVDDYLFCSLRESDINKFESKIKSAFQLNDRKTQKTNNGKYVLFYFGQIFNLETRQVNKLYTFNKNCPVRHRFKIWNYKNPISETFKHRIVSKAMQFSFNNHCFKKLELNTSFNTEETVLKNYFYGMVFIAFKFDVAVIAIKEFQQEAKSMPSLLRILESVVTEYSNIVYSKIRLYKGKNFTGNITFVMLKNIAYRAFVLVLKKKNEFYKDIIGSIRKRNLYIRLDLFNLLPSVFTVLPEAFQNVCVGRKSLI